MAVLGCNNFKDDDPEEAAKHKKQMDNIVRHRTETDEEEESVMPTSTGNVQTHVATKQSKK